MSKRVGGCRTTHTGCHRTKQAQYIKNTGFLVVLSRNICKCALNPSSLCLSPKSLSQDKRTKTVQYVLGFITITHMR